MNKIYAFCGVHGDESNAVKIVNDLQKEKDIFYCVKILNKNALIKNVRCIDGVDLNRHASENDTVCKLVSPFRKTKDLDGFVIDIHNTQNLYNCIVIDDNEYALSYVKFCEKYDIPFCIVDQKNTVKSYSIRNGVPAFTVELNGMGFTDIKTYKENKAFLEKLVDILKNVENIKSFNEIHPRLKHCNLMYTKKYTDKNIDLFYECESHIKQYAREIPYGFYKEGELIMTVNDKKFFAEEDGWVIDVENTMIASNECVLYEFQNKNITF